VPLSICKEAPTIGGALLARVDMPDDMEVTFDGIGLLGGEKRIAYLHEYLHETNRWLNCPDSAPRSSLDHARYVRMMLATPAIFQGWLEARLAQ
jgi:hypothetical protein